MTPWKSSKVFGINYYMMKTPILDSYVTGGPVSSATEAKGELILQQLAQSNIDNLLNNIWNRGIIPIERQIFQSFNRYNHVLNRGVRYGGLLVANTFEEMTISDKPKDRSFDSLYIDDIYSNYDFGQKCWSKKDKLLPAKKNYKIAFFHIWAVRT